MADDPIFRGETRVKISQPIGKNNVCFLKSATQVYLINLETFDTNS